MNEMPPLGNKKPNQIVLDLLGNWVWKDVFDRGQARLAQDPDYHVRHRPDAVARGY